GVRGVRELDAREGVLEDNVTGDHDSDHWNLVITTIMGPDLEAIRLAAGDGEALDRVVVVADKEAGRRRRLAGRRLIRRIDDGQPSLGSPDRDRLRRNAVAV